MIIDFIRKKLERLNKDASIAPKKKAATKPKIREIKTRTPIKQEQIEQPTTEKIPVKRCWSIDLIKELDWHGFEKLCAAYFREKGYRAELTNFGPDGGIDIKLFKDGHSKEKPLGIIQCKAWKNRPIKVNEVRELYGVKAAEEMPLAIFMTTNEYTTDAIEFSKEKHLKLLTGHDILNLIESLTEEKKSRILEEITDGDYKTPTCARCGVKMVKRTSTKEPRIGKEFWGCVNYPKCRSVINI